MQCEGCGRHDAGMQCPTCKKLDLPPSFFCSQECFKASWGAHKVKHTQPAAPTIRTMTEMEQATFNFCGSLRPGRITPRRAVPSNIPRPEYADRPDGASLTEEKDRGNHRVVSWSGENLDKIRRVCALSREVLDIGIQAVRVGVTTDEIDRIVHEATVERGMYPSPLNYYQFPKSVCTSVNEIICHGIPDSRELQEGDIINIDVSSYYDGMHGDLNDTVFVGRPDEDSVRLVHTAYESMMAGISCVAPNNLYKHVGDAIQSRADKSNCSVVRTYTGHGVGRMFHTTPNIPHYGNNKAPGIMRVGHVFTIEPMLNLGTWQDVTWPDKWTSSTKDGKRSAQFEHAMVVTKDGYELLTETKDGRPFYQHQLEALGIPIPLLEGDYSERFMKK